MIISMAFALHWNCDTDQECDKSLGLGKLSKQEYVFTKFIKLYYHRIKYQLVSKLSLTPVSFIGLSLHLCHGDDVCDDGNEAPPPPWPVCLHPLNDVPYWRQVIPSTVSVETWVQGSYVDGFLHPSFKPSGFSCQDFTVLQFHEILRLFKVKVFWSLWGGRTGSPMLVKSWLQGSFRFTYVCCLTLFTLLHRSYHVLFAHRVLGFHQQLL